MPQFIPKLTPADLDDFTKGYLECAEWILDSGTCEQIKAWSQEAIAQAAKDCKDFQETFAIELKEYEEVTGRDMSSAGHDFWLTRNDHGAGFWDRGDDPVLNRLTEASQTYGQCDAYTGGDGLIYLY